MNRGRRIPERRWSAWTGLHCSQIQTRMRAIHGTRQDGIDLLGETAERTTALPHGVGRAA